MGIIENVKTVVALAQAIDNIDLYKRILDLQSDVLKLIEENSALKGEIQSLKDKHAIRGKLVRKNNAYWLPLEGKGVDGPYCTSCWETEEKLITMHPCPDPAFHSCPKCKIPLEAHPGAREESMERFRRALSGDD